MTEQPDPVADALRLRASDADREKVAEVLHQAYVEGRLTRPEHEERLAEVYRATTYADLVPLLEDLPVPPGVIAVPGAGQVVAVSGPTELAPRDDGVIVLDPRRAGEAERNAVAIFSGVERKGAWVVPPELVGIAVMGGVELDLTNAVLTSQVTEFRLFALMGGIEITVPHGVAVRSEVIGIMGGTSTPDGDTPAGAPVIRLTGAAIMGGVDVVRPKPPKKKNRKQISG
jgi:hypothetical protein